MRRLRLPPCRRLLQQFCGAFFFSVFTVFAVAFFCGLVGVLGAS